MDLRLAGRTALVTGSHRGTGAAIAAGLAAEGAHVLVHGLEGSQGLDVLEAITESGGVATLVTGDHRSESGTAELVDAVAAAGRPVDVLVNNYGVADAGAWFDDGTDSDAWLGSYERNVVSGVRLTRSLVPTMVERSWGRVVFVGTVGSARPNSTRPQYYVAKAALPALTLSLAKELSGSGVTVNLVSPGMIATAEVRAMIERQAARHGWEGDWNALSARAANETMPNLVGRITEPEEVAALVTFVSSELAASITGANLRVDGGAADAVSP